MVARRTLLTLARRSGVRVGYPCRGIGLCGRCTVEVIDGAGALEPRTRAEENLAGKAGLPRSERVACLVRPAPGHTLVIRVGGATHRLFT